MFGVGENPIYLERVARREERRQRSGEAQRAEEQLRRDSLIGDLMAPIAVEVALDVGTSTAEAGVVVPAAEPAMRATAAPARQEQRERQQQRSESPPSEAEDERLQSAYAAGSSGEMAPGVLDAIFAVPVDEAVVDDDPGGG